MMKCSKDSVYLRREPTAIPPRLSMPRIVFSLGCGFPWSKTFRCTLRQDEFGQGQKAAPFCYPSVCHHKTQWRGGCRRDDPS
jgi:hypothetical protein